MIKSLVSVVITTYKREIKYVKEAVESAACQTYQPIEVLLVDDNGEFSEYADELRNLCEKYVQVFYCPNKRNSGAQVSRNNGILASKGEFVAFLDDDDIWDPTKIEKQMNLFTSEKIGMVYCDGYSFEDGNKNKRCKFREASIWDRPITYEMELFNDYIGSTSQALIRKACFAVVGMFDTEMPARQDYEMWLRISRKFYIVGVPEKLLFYRVHPGERISTNWEKCFNSYKLILDKYKKDYKKNKYAKSKLILRLFATSLKMENHVSAFKYFLYAFVISPKCVKDVIKRRVTGKSFNEFYSNI